MFSGLRDRSGLDRGALTRYGEVLALAAPATASMLSYTLAGLVDTLMVGPLGAAALGGVGLSNALLFTVGAFFMGMVGGVSPLTAQHEGAGDKARAGLYVHQAIWLAIFGGAALTVSLGLGARVWVGMLSPGEGVADAAAAYLRWRALAFVPVFSLMAYDHLLQGLGDTRTPMRLALTSNALNVVLTAWLVNGGLGVEPQGVAGAAMGTVASYLFTVLQYQWVLAKRSRRDPAYRMWPLRAPDAGAMRQLLKVGLPMGVQFTVDVGAWLALSTFVGWISDEALAATQIVARVVSVPLMAAHGITVAATSLVGRHLGAGQTEKARAYGWTAVMTGLLLTFVIAVPVASLPDRVVGWFTQDPAVQATAAMLLTVAIGLMVAETFANGAYGILQGAGDTRFTMKVTLGATWGVGVPVGWALAFPLGLGANGIYVALGLQMTVISALYVWRIRGGAWLNSRVITPEAKAQEIEAEDAAEDEAAEIALSV